MFKLRAAGVDEVQIVRRAVLEQNGQLTIIKYGEEAIKYPLIQDGQANYDLLDVLDKDIDWLRAEVAKQIFIWVNLSMVKLFCIRSLSKNGSHDNDVS